MVIFAVHWLISQVQAFLFVCDVSAVLNDFVRFFTADTVNFLGISIVGQTNNGGDGGIYVGSIMKGLVAFCGKYISNEWIL